MSLINDALRKARQAAAEHDGQRAGARAPRAHPGRGGRSGTGVGVLVLVAAAAALAGAAGAWWWAAGRGQAEPQLEAAVRQKSAEPARSIEDHSGVAGATSAGGASPEAAAAGTDGLPTVQAEAAAPETVSGRGAVEPSLPRHNGGTSPPAPAAGEASPVPRQAPPTAAAAPGARVFVLDAELGGTTLSLGYIVFRPLRPFAEINGEEVYEGSEIAGFVVERIEADRVILRDGDGPLELRVP